MNYANKVLESDFTIIGCSGCTHELFDHSTVRQANTTNGRIQQETCVTVTLMKFFYRLALLTGESKFVDVVFLEHPLAPYENMLEVAVPLADGNYMHVTDYASAGKDYYNPECKMAAWMLTKDCK